MTSSQSSSVASSVRRGKNDLVERPSPVYTPTRKSSNGGSLCSDLLETQQTLRSPGVLTPSSASRVVVEPYEIQSGSRRRGHSGPTTDGTSASPHTTYCYRIFPLPRLPTNPPLITKRGERCATANPKARDPFFHFTSQERQAIAELVHINPRECDLHPNCTDCHNLEYAYFENKTMPTSMPPEERQKIINNNRSLRNIKNVRSRNA